MRRLPPGRAVPCSWVVGLLEARNDAGQKTKQAQPLEPLPIRRSPFPFPPCLVLIFRLVGGKERGEKSTRKGGKGRGRRRQREPSWISFGLTRLRLAAHGADRRLGRVAPRMVSGAAARRSGGERSEPERLLDFDQAGNRRRSSEQSQPPRRRRSTVPTMARVAAARAVRSRGLLSNPPQLIRIFDS